MNYLLFSGSLRKESLNTKLIFATAKILSQNQNIITEVINLKDFSIPLYDGDIEANGIPDGVKSLGDLVSNSQAIIISGPEYNGSISGVLKNTIDWVSRLRPMPWQTKPILLMGASPGAFGAIRSLTQVRVPFDTLGSHVFPQTMALSKAHEAFDSNGDLLSKETQDRLTNLLEKFDQFALKFS